MKLLELHDNTYHPQISGWITNAKRVTLQRLQNVLEDESQLDPKWFINNRGSRLRQLVDEIFTLALQEASKGKWSIADFEGQEHSDLITKAINSIAQQATSKYRIIRTQILSKEVQDYENKHNM